MTKLQHCCWMIGLLLALTACQTAPPAPPTAISAEIPPTTTAMPPTEMVSPSATPFPSPTAQSTATSIPSPTVPPSPTLNPTLPPPYTNLTIDALRARSYGGGELVVDETMQTSADFTRYLIRYPSDGLTITGFANVPNTTADAPLPVVVLLHGYVNPATYNQLTYTTRYADQLAREGFLVLHPSYRNHVPSDSGPNPFRIGYATDILNLIEIVRQQAGQPGVLAQADPQQIHLWGHSMGGGVALRVATISPHVDRVVLYGSMSGDERKNFEQIDIWSEGREGEFELTTPPEALAQIEPIQALDGISAEIAIHHGSNDTSVPAEWSDELCAALEALGQPVACYRYDGQDHILTGDADALFQARVAAFFRGE